MSACTAVIPSTTGKVPTYAKELLHVPDSVDRSQWKIHTLSPVEISFRLFYTESLLFFYDAAEWTAEGKSVDEFMNLKRMKESLTQLLRYYPIIASRLIGPEGPADEARLENIDHGISFESGESSYRLNELPIGPEEFYSNNPDTPPELRKCLVSLSPTYDFFNPLVPPPFQVRYTRLACGSVCLGVHMHHHVCDMESYMNLMKDWAELYQQLTLKPNSPLTLTLSNPPSLDRSWLACTKEQLEESRLRPHPGGNMLMPGDLPGLTPVVARSYRFSAKELAAMKRSVEADLKPGQWVSTFEVLSAHLARCVYRARNPQLTDEIIASTPATDLPPLQLDMSTNLRKRLDTAPPKSKVFCNAVLPTSCRFTSDSLIKLPLSATALAIHDQLQSRTPAELRATLAWLQTQERKDLITQDVRLDPSNNVIISAWNKFGAYQIAFEPEVKPSRVSLEYGWLVDGLSDILDTEEPETVEGQSLDIYICLSYEVANRLAVSKELHQFRS